MRPFPSSILVKQLTPKELNINILRYILNNLLVQPLNLLYSLEVAFDSILSKDMEPRHLLSR